MSEADQIEIEDFSLATGGLVSDLFARVGLPGRISLRTLLATAVAWLPLFILSFFAGVSMGGHVAIPFLWDYGVYGRILVAIPLLILAEVPIGRRSSQVLKRFATLQLLLEKDIPLLANAIRDATRQKNSILAEVIIIAAIVSFGGVRSATIVSPSVSAWFYTGGKVTPVGFYYGLVSLPIFQFLLIRWMWRLAVWMGLLWRISRLDLQLIAIHPDRMGGLGFIGLAQIPFGLVSFAGGAVISTYLMNNIVYRGVSLTSATGTMVVYVALAVVVLIAPTLVFVGKLVNVRANGILRYGGLGEDYARQFDEKWIGGKHPEDETVLGTSDIQSLADLANSYAIVQGMQIIPADNKTLLVLIASAALPMVAVFFVALPFDAIIARIIGMLGQ